MDAKVSGPLNELGATEIVQKIARGETTCEAVTRDCVARIAERDGVVKAWVNFDPELALAQARALDRSQNRGPLHGVPIGVKDIIDTFDMPTEFGSPIYKGHRPPSDAACVALLRRAGAVMLGKTATCEFAGMAPPETTNPHNPAHTPGGSSSGSAAAVADDMVPAALGTQTGGSVLRPSSYCGIFGFKPTYNTFNKAGVKPAAESIDTIGWLARSLDDIELLTAVLSMQAPQPPRTMNSAPRIGLCRTEMWDAAQPETKAAVEGAAAALAKAGATVREVKLPDPFTGLRIDRPRDHQFPRARRLHGLRMGPSSRGAVAADAALYRARPKNLAAGLHRRLAPHRGMPRAVAFGVRRARCFAGAMRARRSAEGSCFDRRRHHAGDLDGAAHAEHDAADPSRAEQSAGRHPTGRAALRRRSAVRLRAMDLAKNRRAGDDRLQARVE